MPSLLKDRTREAPRAAQRPSAARRVSLGIGAGVVLAVLVAVGWRAADLFPSWDNPVQQKVVDRSTPPLMLALQDLNEYHAAAGTFQVVIDQERDTRYVPSVISGERTTFLATGTVDSIVDFSTVGPETVKMSADRRAVTISLPAARLGKVRVDPNQSRVIDRDRGVVERVGGMFADNPSSEGELYALAQTKVGRAAAASDLQRRAEANTRAMLTGLARSLGFTQVTVTFDSPL